MNLNDYFSTFQSSLALCQVAHIANKLSESKQKYCSCGTWDVEACSNSVICTLFLTRSNLFKLYLASGVCLDLFSTPGMPG